jgi:LacI family transcriptional regulator
MPILDVVDVPVPAMQGVLRFLQERPGWRMQARWFSREHICRDIAESASVGVIVAWHWPHSEQQRQLQHLAKPLVGLLDSDGVLGAAVVDVDDVAVGRMAAAYLLARGRAELAFCGVRGLVVSERRWQGFQEVTRSAGRPARFLAVSAEGQDRELQRQLAELPRPVAVLAFADGLASRIIEWFAAEVPERMAVLGVDNAPMFCDFTLVPLSSVAPDLEGMGYRAARLLVDAVERDSVPVGRYLVPPRAVVPRLSTQLYAYDSDLVQRAMRLIAEGHPGERDVEGLAACLQCSRSTLQRQFQQAMRLTPGEVIRQHALQEARRLLIDSNEPVAAVAKQCGFGNASAFTRAFRRFFGDSPRDIRSTL